MDVLVEGDLVDIHWSSKCWQVIANKKETQYKIFFVF